MLWFEVTWKGWRFTASDVDNVETRGTTGDVVLLEKEKMRGFTASDVDNVETRGATGDVVFLEKEKMRGFTVWFCGNWG